MEIRLGGSDNEYLFKYNRSRFRSAVIGTLVTSLLTAALGVVVWPIFRDMGSNSVETLRIVSLALTGALALLVLTWIYYIVRMVALFSVHIRESGMLHHSVVPAWIVLLVTIAVVVTVPLIILSDLVHFTQ